MKRVRKIEMKWDERLKRVEWVRARELGDELTNVGNGEMDAPPGGRAKPFPAVTRILSIPDRATGGAESSG